MDEACWDEVIDACRAAWPEKEKLVYNNSPAELIYDIINERDEAEQRGRAAALAEAVAKCRDCEKNYRKQFREFFDKDDFVRSQISSDAADVCGICAEAITGLITPEALAAAEARVVRRWLEERKQHYMTSRTTTDGAGITDFIDERIRNIENLIFHAEKALQQEAGDEAE